MLAFLISTLGLSGKFGGCWPVWFRKNCVYQGNSEGAGLSNFDIGFIREIRRLLACLI